MLLEIVLDGQVSLYSHLTQKPVKLKLMLFCEIS